MRLVRIVLGVVIGAVLLGLVALIGAVDLPGTGASDQRPSARPAITRCVAVPTPGLPAAATISVDVLSVKGGPGASNPVGVLAAGDPLRVIGRARCGDDVFLVVDAAMRAAAGAEPGPARRGAIPENGSTTFG